VVAVEDYLILMMMMMIRVLVRCDNVMGCNGSRNVRTRLQAGHMVVGSHSWLEPVSGSTSTSCFFWGGGGCE
jgi:hypothetical protein